MARLCQYPLHLAHDSLFPVAAALAAAVAAAVAVFTRWPTGTTARHNCRDHTTQVITQTVSQLCRISVFLRSTPCLLVGIDLLPSTHACAAAAVSAAAGAATTA